MRINRERLAVAMIRAELNGCQLASKAGLSRGTVTAVKTGKSCSKDTALKLVAILGADILQDESVRNSVSGHSDDAEHWGEASV